MKRTIDDVLFIDIGDSDKCYLLAEGVSVFICFDE